MLNELPEKNDDEKILIKISEQIRIKISQAYSWIDSAEGKIISRATASLTSFVIGDPTGMVIPIILESSDYAVRKRFVKHFPDLIERLNKKQFEINQKFLKSDIGQQLLKDTLKEIIHQTSEEKIEYLKNFLLRSYTLENPESERIAKFFKILKDMDPIHIKLLTVLKEPKAIVVEISEKRQQNPLPEEQKRHGKNNCSTFWEEDGMDDLNEFYLKSDPIVYVTAQKDLVTWGIVENKMRNFWLYFDKSTFDSNLETHVHEIQRWTTPFGRQFMAHLYDS